MSRLNLALGLVVALAAAAPLTAASEELFAVDTDLDELVVLESTTGLVTRVVGPLGRDASYMEALTTLPSGQIYGLYSVNNLAFHFVEISRTTGAVLRDILLPVSKAEGLADHPETGELFIAYTALGLVPSTRIGKIDPGSGAILDLGAISFIPESLEDADDLRFADDGTLYLMDALCCGDGSSLYRMSGTTGTLVGTCDGAYSNVNQIEFLPSGWIVGLDSTSDLLVTISRETGAVVSNLPVGRTTLSGLARVVDAAVPVVERSWGSLKTIYR
jgi:hypothetical protein